MAELHPFFEGIYVLFEPQTLIWLLIGFVTGVVVGAIPGFSEGTFLAMLLPFTVYMDPWNAMVFMSAVYIAAEMAGSYSAILVNMPGTAGTFATTIEGYALTRKGLATRALSASMTASLFGGVAGSIMFIVIGPLIASFALAFRSPEMFMVALLGLTAVGSLTGGSPLKGLFSGLLGLLLATTGIDPLVGEPRATFGFIGLYDGIPLIPALIGLFGFSELLRVSSTRTEGAKAVLGGNRGQELWRGAITAMRHYIPMMRSAFVGFVIGIIPGTGAATASVVSYGQGRQWSRKPEEFGSGSIEGLVCSDTANNAAVPAALIPTLALGIPGSGTAVIMLALLTLHGLHPGPGFWDQYAAEAYLIGVTFLVSATLILVICFPAADYIAKIAYMPIRFLIPVITVLMMVGVYSSRNLLFDAYIMVFFGVLGYLLKHFGYSVAALLLAVILGPMMEENLLRSLALGGPMIFLREPVSLVLLGCVLISLIMPFFLARRRRAVTTT